MSATALIMFREVLEAALVVGIVLAATRGLERRGTWVSIGIVLGTAGAVIVALFAEAVASAAAGMGQELFNAAVLFVAVAMLGWHNAWMSRHAREMAQHISAVGNAIVASERPISALAIVVGVAVLREGSEVVLFLYGIAAAQGSDTAGMLAGSVLGLALGALAGAIIYFGLVRFTGRYLFAVTSWLILLLAAGMAAHGAKFLLQAGYLPALGHAVWDTSAIISDHGPLGSVLQALVGYTERPDGIQLLFFVATLTTIGGLMYAFRRPRAVVPSLAVLAIGSGLAVFAPPLHDARALHLKVESPIIEEGEFAVEYRGNLTGDNEQGTDGEHTQYL